MKLVWTLLGCFVLLGGCRASRASSAQSRPSHWPAVLRFHRASPDSLRQGRRYLTSQRNHCLMATAGGFLPLRTERFGRKGAL